MTPRDRKILKAYTKAGARIEIKGRVKLKDRTDLALFYTPGVGVASTYLAKHPEAAREMSVKRNSVAIISDGSAVLGLGNIGPYGALPVMEGKALIFKEFAGINLEDIKSPQCFYVEQRIREELDIPVMHDDQHGTAIVVLAGLINAAKVVK